MDLLYHFLEIKFRKKLRSWIFTGFHLKQEEFFKITPPRFLVDIEIRPKPWLGIAFLGMQEHDKRHADQGLGKTLFPHVVDGDDFAGGINVHHADHPA